MKVERDSLNTSQTEVKQEIKKNGKASPKKKKVQDGEEKNARIENQIK